MRFMFTARPIHLINKSENLVPFLKYEIVLGQSLQLYISFENLQLPISAD